MNDGDLIRIVDSAMAESARRSGDWLVCKPGCTQCCHGPFEITMLDATRLQAGLAALDEATRRRILERAQAYVDHVGGASLEELLEDEAMDDVPCPALDPTNGRCDLYASRPLMCRTFGPPALAEDGSYSVCELCFEGASEAQIAACRVDPDPDGLEAQLMSEHPGVTYVAAALIGC